MNLRAVIIDEISKIAEERGLTVGVLEDETVLLESGLDSIGFAVLVVRLEQELGYDPFTMINEPVYPKRLHFGLPITMVQLT